MRLIRFVRSHDFSAILLLVLWPFVYYWPVALGQRAFTEGDILWINFPIRTELARALVQGRLPLWTPDIQAGLPLLAEGQAGALYPINLLLYRLLPPQYAFSYIVLINLAFASIGMYLLCRALGLGYFSALLAGFVFGASGAMIAHVSHLDVLTTICWLPWLAVFQQKYWQAKLENNPTSVWFVLGCFSIGLQFLGGFPPIALLNIIACALFGILGPSLLGERKAPRLSRSTNVPLKQLLPGSVIVTGVEIILGTGLAAIQLLPTAELTGLSIRAQEMGRSFYNSYSLAPLAISQFLVPFGYLGAPSADNMEFWGYMGVLPVFLALSALFLRRDRRTFLIFLFGVLILSLALGGVNPLYNWLYYVPVFNRFRIPARFLFLFCFSVALLAAFGFDELLTRLKPSLCLTWKSLLLGVMLIVATLGVIYLAYTQPVEFWSDVWQWLPIFLVSAAVGTIIVAKRGAATQTSFALIALGLTVTDLAAFSAPFLATLTRMESPAELVQIPRTVLAMDDAKTPYRVFVDRFPSVTQAAIRATLWSGLPLVYGKEGVLVGYNPFTLALQRNELFVKNMSLTMRDLMNIRYYLLPLETAPPGGPSPFDQNEPDGGLTLSLLRQQPAIPPTPVARVELVSYTDQSKDLPDGFMAGELLLTSGRGNLVTLPIRLGRETADWAYDGIGSVGHSKPANSLSFPAYLASVGHEFQGSKYIARYDLRSEMTVTAVDVRSFLPDAELTVESVSLTDAQGHSVSLAALLHRNDLALVFRSHTAAMWENRSVLPRAFMVHAAEVVKDEETLARLAQPDFRLDQVVLLADGQTMRPKNVSATKDSEDQVTIADYESERVVIKVNTASVGYLVLTDSWYPGWEASVDGQSAPIHRADYIFRAVELQPGEHTVVFEYRPLSFAIGAAISGVSLLICVGLAVFAYRRAKSANSVARP